MQPTLSRIWTHITVSNFCKDKHYTTGTSLSLSQHIYIYIYVYIYRHTFLYIYMRLRFCVKSASGYKIFIILNTNLCRTISQYISNMWNTCSPEDHTCEILRPEFFLFYIWLFTSSIFNWNWKIYCTYIHTYIHTCALYISDNQKFIYICIYIHVYIYTYMQ